MLDLASIRLFLFDVDGVFVTGKEQPRLLSGRRILHVLRERNLPFRLVTNTSTHPRDHLASKLLDLGLPAGPEDIHSAFETTVTVAARRFPGGRCFAVGETPLLDQLEASGLRLVRDFPADVVVVALSRTADYEMLSAAARCLKHGPRCSHATRTGCGWTNRATVSLQAPGSLPSSMPPAWSPKAWESQRAPSSTRHVPVGVAAQHTLMIGNDCASDVAGAQQAGLRGGLVLTGKTRREHLDAIRVSPDLVLEEVDDLVERLVPQQHPSH